jgi:hypothetical protein
MGYSLLRINAVIANIMHLEATDEYELPQCPDTVQQTVI